MGGNFRGPPPGASRRPGWDNDFEPRFGPNSAPGGKFVVFMF